MRAAKSRTVASEDFALCSNGLIENLAKNGVRAVACAVIRKCATAPELAGSSAGASVAFTDLCLALAEAPVGAHVHEIDVAGFGRVSWKAAELESDGRSDLVVFALHEDAAVRTMSTSQNLFVTR